MTNKDHIQTVASEFQGDEQKLINKIANDGNPSFKANEEFKTKLDSKIQEQINLTKEQRERQAVVDAVPKNLKWRFYLTGYGYAVCTFLVLFLIGFCTNIFTGTLNVPTKYNYIEENQAFGDLERGGELAYDYRVNKASNFSYYDGITEEREEAMVTASSNSLIVNSVSEIAETQALGLGVNKAITSIDSVEDDASDIFMNDGFAYDKTYRFAYKDKLFPKLGTQYSIYKSSGILMGSNASNQFLKNLKIGGVSFRNFHDLELVNFEIEQDIDNGYSIFFDSRTQKLHFYPNSSWEAKLYDGTLPSKKTILKNVEKNLKELGVSLKNYGDGMLDIDGFDKNMGIIQVFYPLQIQGKSVYDPYLDEQIGMRIAYDLNLGKVVSVIGIDIATYDVSNYPTQDKKSIELEIEQGGGYYNQGALHENSTVILFDSMEIVYIEKVLDNGEKIYVPAIRGNVSTSLENYTGPSSVYEEII